MQGIDLGTIEIYTILGKLSYKGNLNDDIKSIPINNVSGYYLVKVITQETIYSKKVFISSE